MERHGLVDTGITWSVSHSGRTIATTEQWAQMMAAAGHTYDVLVVGYVSRFARDLRTAVNARHDLHAAGAVILFADDRVLSSDEDAWDQWARETVEAESYSRKLARRVTEGYAAKFRRLGDQAGAAPLGFRRVRPAQTLAIDPATIGTVVAMFTRYASGAVSTESVAAEYGIEPGAAKEILRNPIYNGWVRRYRRSDREERRPAAWREDPPVSDALWARVEGLRTDRTRASRRPSTRRPLPMLGGLLWCPCGEHIASNGTQGADAHPMVIHRRRDCAEWGPRRTQPTLWYEETVAAQVTSIDLSDASLARIVAAVTAPELPAPASITRGQMDRRRRDLALDHAAGRLTDDAYMAAVTALRKGAPEGPPRDRLEASEVVAQLRALPEAWEASSADRRRELVASIYERIEIRGQSFVGATLTPAAEAMGLALAMREKVDVVSRGGLGRTASTRPLPILGRRDWLRVARRAG